MKQQCAGPLLKAGEDLTWNNLFQQQRTTLWNPSAQNDVEMACVYFRGLFNFAHFHYQLAALADYRISLAQHWGSNA